MGGVEIVFLDVETTIPYKKGQKFEILEFGAIVLCAQGLVEKTSFSTYVQPSSMAAISKKSVDCNGITKNVAAHAPFFSQIADHVYNLLDGRVWAGHNILSFDIPRIQEAFAEAGLQAPTAAGVIDTLPLLKSTFGCRAGNMKMASLASYCGLGEQAHRSLEDVQMNIQILKSCATMLFLEDHFSSLMTEKSDSELGVSCTTESLVSMPSKNCPKSADVPFSDEIAMASSTKLLTTRLEEPAKIPTIETGLDVSQSSRVFDLHVIAESLEGIMGSELDLNGNSSEEDGEFVQQHSEQISVNVRHSLSEVLNVDESCVLNQHLHMKKMEKCVFHKPYSSSNLEGSEEWSVARCCMRHTLNSHTKCISGVGELSNSSIGQIEGENPWLQVKKMSGVGESSDAGVGQIEYEPYASWLQVKDINERQVCVVKGPNSWGKKIPVVMYRGSPLCIYECDAIVRFSVREAYDQMRKLSFSLVLQPSQHTYDFFHALDASVKSKYVELGGQSQWRPLVWREGEADVIRIRIVTTGTGASAVYTTQFHQRTEGRLRRTLTLGSVDPVAFRRWIPPGSRVDVLLAPKVYDIQSTAGLQLIAHDLTLH
ncbi:hypothetical protein CY35_12G048900 [Sphagnum magellanicum]|nr:hypothetical protein CY35_12G048900 [Sphagnum magellanicum]